MNLQNSTLRYVHLACAEDLEGYVLRQQQPLPSTPRVSINSQNQQILSVYVENLSDSFLHGEWQSFSLGTIYQYLQTAIIANMGLKKKFGCFMINQNLIKLSSNNSLKVWINEDPVLNYRQSPLAFERASETLMVEAIIKLFKPLIPELGEIGGPETLQSFLSEVRLQKKSQVSFSKTLKVQSNYSHPRKAIKSFYNMPKPRQIPSKFNQMNCSMDGIGNPKSYLTTLSKHNSPNNLSFSQKKHDAIFESPSTSFSKLHNSIAIQMRNRLVSFTYSSPISMKNSMMELGTEGHHFIDPVLERTAQPTTQSYRQQQQSQNIKGQENIEGLEQKEKLFSPPKFPYSTQSTFVSFKENKSLSDMHSEHFENIPIEQQKRNESNLRNSSKGSKGSHQQISRKASCNEFSNGGSKKSKSAQEIKQPIEQPVETVDIEDQFDNLFFGDKESENSKEEEEFIQRELQFQDILFS